MSSPRLDMVVFDLGGVLIRICRTWEEACRRAGVPVHPHWNDENDRASRKALSSTYHRGGVSTPEYFARIAATGGGAYTPEEIRRVHDAWLIGEYEGVGALIDELHARGVGTGVLSNTNEAHWERLSVHADAAAPGAFGVTSKVRHLHASHLLRESKPDPACFRAFEALAGLKNANARVLFFDDLEENIAGARAAGWSAVLVDHQGDTAAQMRRAMVHTGVLR